MDRKYYAHSLPGRPKKEWQRLEEHLRNVAEMARGLRAPSRQKEDPVQEE